MLNSVNLCGRLTRDIDLRYTQSGKAVGSFSLAVNRNFKNSDGDYEADFINCTIWGKSAENLANFVSKGSLINVSGRLNTRSYDNKQGQKVYVTEVIVENFDLLDSKNKGNKVNQTDSKSHQSKDPFANSGDAIDIDNSMLPF
jgi:single-strand DNA-binding protein